MTIAETVLETDRLRLTNWLPDQVDDLVALHGDPEVARYLDADAKPWSREKARTSLKTWAQNFSEHRMGKLRLIRKSDGAFVGRAGYGIYPPTGEPELGYALFKDHWGNGYALEAASGLRDWIFRETTWDHFIGLADTRNVASLKILEKIGMTPTHQEREPTGLMAQFFIYRREDLHDR